ncbi:hypothetical protein [Paracoccus benzoatiresistens]|uniref:Uncharacterized protein n=1 Tax=Paracoccus benzoatiresistens TaxID=2997341 RepID=A0ABT4J2P4_9RHOB|nr:hypothetical protein [Paracoccus sp. EF6]MCZ0960897.1 hypothetical protein [Paracoccus sp. EF6]
MALLPSIKQVIMRPFPLLLSVFSVATAVPASARTVHLQSCVATIGGFCPVETVGGGLAALVVFFFAGIPLRFMIKRHIRRRVSDDPGYVPSDALTATYRNAGRLTLMVVGLIVAASMFSSMK